MNPVMEKIRTLMAEGKTDDQIVKELGLGSEKRPMPDDFPEYASTHTYYETRERYRCGSETMRRWKKQAGIEPNVKQTPTIPILMPQGYEAFSRANLQHVVCERFGLSTHYVRIFDRQLGIDRSPKASAKLKRASSPGQPPKKAQVLSIKPRNITEEMAAREAATYLQRYSSMIRCNAEGQPRPSGTHWLRGGRYVLTDAEVIERARGMRERAAA